MAQAPGSGLFAPFGEIGRDLAAVDWAATPLGIPENWPASLRNIVRLQLGSRFAMWMAWGPELTFLCNDAYRRDTLGAKYPWALGRPAKEVWAEIWPDIGPRIESVISTGNATWDEDLMLFLERSGYPEETYHTFSYSPINDDEGHISGMLCVVSEETSRVIGERRIALVRDLGTALAAARTEAEVCAAAGRQLAGKRSVPFVLGYLFDDERTAHVAFTSNVTGARTVAPARIKLDDQNPPWPVREAAAGRQVTVPDLPERFAHVPTGVWDDPPQQAMVVPLAQPGAVHPFGFLVAALNPYRPLDADYRDFIGLIAGQVAAAITRARVYEQERKRAEDLAELDRAKTAFFTNVSHELRTPLTLLLGPSADALEDQHQPLGDAQRERVEVIQRNAERLLKLVNTLLDFSRMESGRMQARFEPLDLARYTRDLAQMFESTMHRVGLDFTVDVEPLPERVHVDREMWAKIVLNLLSNALKATFTGGVTVRLRAAGHGGAELEVIDTGIGIPPAEQERLFERFHRVSGAALRSHEGSGIGLALVAELAHLHGGAVAVRSRPGAGSTFTVRIPLGTAHLPAEHVVGDSDDELFSAEQFGSAYVSEANRWLAEDDWSEDAAPAGGRQRVLVVDDNADMRGYVSGLLRDDYAVTTANDGQAALDLALERPPDIVLTDVMMPRLDGFGLLAALRAHPRTMHIPVVMLSARSDENAAVEGLEAGADDYLVKPFSARELHARVRANLELDRVRRVAAELARSQQLLDQAEELAHVGSWQVDLSDNSMTASPELYRIVGADPSEAGRPGGMQLAADRVAPADIKGAQRAFARVLKTGEPFDLALTVVRPDGGERVIRIHGVPVRDDDGAISLLRGSVQDITEQRLAEAAIASSAAAREAAAREHAIADELQRSLLPATSLPLGPLDVFGLYRSGVEDTQAGGDWYDVIDLGNQRTALVIGDVMGRGVRAAAVMGQLRATVHAYARLDLPPERVLALLDDAVLDLPNRMIVTCVYAVYDAATASLTYGNAGHVPPLLCQADGSVHRLSVGDPPLGTGHYRGKVDVVRLEAGDCVALYTDGLVEHRGSDIDEGINRLADLFSTAGLPWEGLPAHLADSVLSTAPDDDVAILIAARRGHDDARPVVVPLPRTDTAVSAARQAIADVLAGLPFGEDETFDVLLAGSELVTNAVRYGAAPIELRVRCTPGTIVLEVLDGATTRPALRDLEPSAMNGRGLHLMSAVAQRWGVRPTGTGKAVWCEFPLP